MLRFSASAVLILCVTTCSTLAQDKTTIENLNERFVTAFSKGDYEGVAAMYAEDAYLLPPGTEMVKGRAGIKSFWSKAGEAIEEVKLSTVDVQSLAADSAREIGTFRLKTKGTQPQEITGKYVVVWRRVGSDWKLYTDIWNADK